MSLDLPLTRPCEYDATSKAFQKNHPSTAALALGPNRIVLAKYDGVCGLAVFRQGQPPRMLSRTGEDYSISCQAILGRLSQALENYGWDGSPVMLAGEVWRRDCEQPKISGDFRQQHSIIHDFQFRLFDMVYLDQEPSKQPYYVRLDRYRELASCAHGPSGLDRTHIGWADRVHLEPTDTPEQIARTMGPGYDGIVVWDVTALPLLDKKASNSGASKVKPNITLDVRCNGGIQGEGKHAGRLGALTFSYNGKTGSVGTGFSDKEREDLWRGLCAGNGVYPNGNPAGLIFEVEAMGYTPDGNLREPRFKGFRFDKKESD